MVGLLCASSKTSETRFSLTAENQANILEQMRPVVKRFLSHRGFSPVIMIVPPHVIRDQSDGSGWRPLETTRRAKPAV
jgi:hypothetical protein